jgi:RNA polymerase sigma factor (sigma-70 family)
MNTAPAYPMRSPDAVDWKALAARYANLVYSIPLKHRLGSHDAAEVFQNTWMVALSKAEVPEDAGMAPWLAAIACFQTKALLRRKRRFDRLDDDAVALLPDVDGSSRADPLVEAEEEQALREALDGLSWQDRFIIQSIYLSDKPVPHAQIAQSLGIKPNSVSVRKQRAVEKLYASLRDFASA